MSKKIIKFSKSVNTTFILVDVVEQTYNGKRYQNSYWLECDEEGEIVDANGDGIIQNRTLLCRIPDGCESIEYDTLSEDCLS